MFGTEDVITQILPDYFLDYREKYDLERWSDRVVSNLGEWSGNVFDFFFRIAEKVTADIKRPFRMRNLLEREDDTAVHKAIREALANAIIHADYYGRRGIVIEKRKNEIRIANPGTCRPDIKEILEGDVSDPRNPTIFKMFALIDIGERAGSGIFNLVTLWKQTAWGNPVLEESFDAERTFLSIPVELEEIATDENNMEKPVKIETVEKIEETVEKDMPTVEKTEETVERILKLLQDNPNITQKNLVKSTGLTRRGVEWNISQLKAKGLVERIGPDKGGYWKILDVNTKKS
jgi:predicted HTH transcriptional regulator